MTTNNPISTKQFEFDDPAEATRNYLVWAGKLKDLFKQSPVFWYSVSLVVNEKGKHVLYVDSGKINELNIKLNDFGLS